MDYKQELELIRKKHDGVLKPADVVDFARNPATALHERFEWNNTKAADEYRLWQARELIRVVVKVADDKETIPLRLYCSLSEDRQNDGGGYRLVADVMRSAQMRASLLRQAEQDMVRFQHKYHQLQELASVIQAMRNAQAQTKKPTPSRRGVAVTAV